MHDGRLLRCSEGKLRATTDFPVVRELDTVDICVPTPIRKTKDPDMSYIVSATEAIAGYIHPGMLVVLESTTYPGTTEESCCRTADSKGIKAGKDFFLCFSPEARGSGQTGKFTDLEHAQGRRRDDPRVHETGRRCFIGQCAREGGAGEFDHAWPRW